MSLLATSWATPGALDLLKFKPGGEYYDTFHQLQKIRGIITKICNNQMGLMQLLALWCPFRHNAPACHVMGNTGCAQFC
jgi:hypothetical protein